MSVTENACPAWQKAPSSTIAPWPVIHSLTNGTDLAVCSGDLPVAHSHIWNTCCMPVILLIYDLVAKPSPSHAALLTHHRLKHFGPNMQIDWWQSASLNNWDYLLWLCSLLQASEECCRERHTSTCLYIDSGFDEIPNSHWHSQMSSSK